MSDQPPPETTLRDAEELLERVENALERLEAGEYGRCARCGAPIETAELERDPTVERCAAHREPDAQSPAPRPDEPIETPGRSGAA